MWGGHNRGEDGVLTLFQRFKKRIHSLLVISSFNIFMRDTCLVISSFNIFMRDVSWTHLPKYLTFMATITHNCATPCVVAYRLLLS